MNEEWYNDQVRLSSDIDWVSAPYDFSPVVLTVCQRPNYDVWLNQVVAEYQLRLDRKDRMFARFLLDLPSVPSDVFTLLRDLCTEPDRYVRLSLTDLLLKDLRALECRSVFRPYVTLLSSGQLSVGKQ
jgi:hypothetical protein